MTRLVPMLAALALLAAGCGGGGPERGQGGGGSSDIVVELVEQNSSGQAGTATLAIEGDTTGITIELIAATGGVGDSLPTHVHKGTCADLDPEAAFTLPDTFDGISGDTIDVPYEELKGQYSIDVHAMGGGDLVSCGEIK